MFYWDWQIFLFQFIDSYLGLDIFDFKNLLLETLLHISLQTRRGAACIRLVLKNISLPEFYLILVEVILV